MWDFIGQLQSRKVKDIAAARAADPLGGLGVRSPEAGGAPGAKEVLIQVNVAGEDGKAGIAPEELGDFIARSPVPGDRPDDDAAVRGSRRGQPAPLREAGRAGGRSTARPTSRWGPPRTTRSRREEGATIVRLGSVLYD